MKILSFFTLFFLSVIGFSQTNTYLISFENAVHHEATVTVTFPDINTDTLSVRMSRTSPGRYALHEFAKNVYGLKAFDSKGNALQVIRPNPYEWQIIGHDGTVQINYIVFANRGDGTYSQIDETHAHLNIPATFIYAPGLQDREIHVNFKVREDLGWKVATQLQQLSDGMYSAPNLAYFMDSPSELSAYHLREFEVTDANGNQQNIRLALHHNGSEAESDAYFEQVKKVVLAEKEVYGELPVFDFGEYTFLACYLPNASGDGMEHRNSTILTSTRSLVDGGMERNIGTVSHEFFHAWNVERIRPKSLEPFDFEEANMSGELWFAEGFTSYYTGLILCRAGIVSPEKYVEGLTRTFNYVWNSPARQFFNPIEMSFQAPFVDAATSVDPVNRENTFISYYSYGSVLGLALDLSLREQGLHLDDYMKMVWQAYGKTEKSYVIKDLHNTLNEYAGKAFGDAFFNTYIYKSGMPAYEKLLSSVGVTLKGTPEKPYLGISAILDGDGHGAVTSNPKIGSPAYKAGMDKGDVIMAINNMPFPTGENFDTYIEKFKVGDSLSVSFERFGKEKTTQVILESNPNYSIFLMEKEGGVPSSEVLEKRKQWLKIK
ncbi:PDZ domain-containing protein [Maribacter sp.]|nr:PDZ domain-containing protein [Maribacter sp.]